MAENEIIEAGVNENTEIAVSRFSEVVQSVMNEAQWQILCGKTPKKHIKKRQGKGGMVFSYVPHGYVTSQLNKAFGFDWSWDILPQEGGKMFLYIEPLENMKYGSLIVHGKLTVNVRNPKNVAHVLATITKTSVGEVEVMKGTTWGDAIKTAESDALKKAASRLGVALDLYWQDADEDYLEEEAAKSKGDIELMRLNGMENAEIARRLDEDGMGRSAIAKALGVPITDVMGWLVKNGA